MTQETKTPGCLMAAEAVQCLTVFAASAVQDVPAVAMPDAIDTVARGSSDAAANILSYEFMRELGIPVTSLPPSIFSIGDGVAMHGAAALVISQSGASHDLVLSAKGASKTGGTVLAITNAQDSLVEGVADVTLPIGAGPELAVPATKSVVGSVAVGMAMLGRLKLDYAAKAQHAANAVTTATLPAAQAEVLQAAFLRARHVYVIGRDTGLADIQDSLDQAEARFRSVDCDVHRVRLSDLGVDGVTPRQPWRFCWR